MKVKVNDTVLVITGEDKGKQGKVIRTLKKDNKVVVEGVNIVLASAGGSTSLALAPEAVKRGCVFIDNSSAYRMDKDCPLVIGIHGLQEIVL